MSGATFGRKATADGTALAARRDAFLAEERARAQRPVQTPDISTEPCYIRQKTLGTAYLLWFILGGFSAHRFYLGYQVSGAIQAVLAPIGYALLVAESGFGLLVLASAWLWILADAFLIPGMQREANAQSRRDATASVVA